MKLYRINNGIGSYYVIANDPTEAEKKVIEQLNKSDYGTTKSRCTVSIDVVAEAASEDRFITNKFLIL